MQLRRKPNHDQEKGPTHQRRASAIPTYAERANGKQSNVKRRAAIGKGFSDSFPESTRIGEHSDGTPEYEDSGHSVRRAETGQRQASELRRESCAWHNTGHAISGGRAATAERLQPDHQRLSDQRSTARSGRRKHTFRKVGTKGSECETAVSVSRNLRSESVSHELLGRR